METRKEATHKTVLPGVEAASFSTDLDRFVKDFIYSDAADKYGRSREERIRLYEQFRDANLYSLKKVEKKLSHRHIPVILDIIGNITLRELFIESGIPVNWPNIQCEQMVVMFEALDKKDVVGITDLCRRLCPTCMKEASALDHNPTKRALEYFQHTFSSVVGSRQIFTQIPKELSDTIKKIRTGKKTVIPFEQLPILVEKMSTSLKWIFAQSEDVAVMCRDLHVDNAMDMYLRLPEDNRKRIAFIVESLYEDKKKKEGK